MLFCECMILCDNIWEEGCWIIAYFLGFMVMQQTDGNAIRS